MGLFYGLITSTSPIKLSILFIIQYSIVALIGLSLDIFLEGYTSNHANVGKIRGLYASTLNASWVIAPLIGSLLINGTENYRNTYIAAFLMLFPLAYLIYKNFPRFKDPHYSHPSPWQLIKHISQNSNWDKLFVANTILQTFYSWMVIYSAVYLNKYVGFGWEQIGIILVIMLIPFPLIQYPLGKIADEKYGEKEIMVAGFIIMGMSTISLAFISGKSLFVWALFFFITRIGAAMVEMMIETYFFKTVPPKDTPVLSMFRITRPFSYLIAPLVTGFGLLFMGHQHLFILVGIIVLIGLYPALTIQDTK
jgi:MFS family permease